MLLLFILFSLGTYWCYRCKGAGERTSVTGEAPRDPFHNGSVEEDPVKARSGSRTRNKKGGIRNTPTKGDSGTIKGPVEYGTKIEMITKPDK